MKTTVDQLVPEDKKKIIRFLQDHPVGVLATVDTDGNPHASPLYVNTNDNLRVTFTTKRGTVKYQNITRNDHVMVVVYEAASQTAVQISGRALEVADDQDQQSIYHGTLRAARQTGQDEVPPIAKITAGAYVAFEITIENIWLSDFGWGSSFANAITHANDPRPSGDPA
jgi:general stress protein 26